ncbi:hypothetical protein DM02DRAFT_262685 [Periconia macrospinosa]|uniref:Uncharacterized protein n=1 Tax=Periconia macrospinosa TaxID=97972 RepID=A0A2V1D455_9PLEO|nr:hypothetical protein DM02DRAFT_262685 [Periconia macrospinosa]
MYDYIITGDGEAPCSGRQELFFRLRGVGCVIGVGIFGVSPYFCEVRIRQLVAFAMLDSASSTHTRKVTKS